MLASVWLELMPSLAAALLKWTPEATMTDCELFTSTYSRFGAGIFTSESAQSGHWQSHHNKAA